MSDGDNESYGRALIGCKVEEAQEKVDDNICLTPVDTNSKLQTKVLES